MSDTATLGTIIVAAGTGLATAVGVLFRRVIELQDRTSTLQRDVGKLEGRQDGIQELSAKVLATVHQAVTGNDPPSL